jgi:hypothetical protein
MSLSDIKEIIIVIKSTNIFSLHSNIYSQVFSEHFTLIDLFATATTTRIPSLAPSPTRTILLTLQHASNCRPAFPKPNALLSSFPPDSSAVLQNLRISSPEENASHLPHHYQDPAARFRKVRDQSRRVSTQTFCPLWSPARSPGPSFFLSCSVRILLRFTFRLPANGEGDGGRFGCWSLGFGDVSGEVAYLLICFAIVFL